MVPRVAITEGEDPYAAIDDAASLLALVQIGVLELHVWGSRAEHLDQPDVIVFDLDPAPRRAVERGRRPPAFDVKERLEALGLNAFAKLTGGKGLHVVVPVKPGPTWPAVKKFTRAFVNEMVRDEPRRFVASMSKAKRVGKIFIDYLRNDAEATAIGAYSPRARAGAPVALPIEWDELQPDARTRAAVRRARGAAADSRAQARSVGRVRRRAPLARRLTSARLAQRRDELLARHRAAARQVELLGLLVELLLALVGERVVRRTLAPPARAARASRSARAG